MPGRTRTPQLPTTPPTTWPAATLDPARAPLGVAPAAVAHRDDDPWTTWQVAVVAVVGVLVGLTVGIVTGARISTTDPRTDVAASAPADRGDPAATPGTADPAAPAPLAPGLEPEASAPAGTPDNPVPLGASYVLGGHSLRVLSVEVPGPDASEPVRVRVELVADGSHPSADPLGFVLVDAGGALHAPEPDCGAPVQPFDRSGSLTPGEALTGHVCFAVEQSHVPGALLVAEVLAGHPIHYELG